VSENKTEKTTASPAHQGARWNRIEVFHEGEGFFAALEKAVNQATSTIELESYIFATDRLGYRVLDVLGKAAARGVVVRIIVDGIGSTTWVSKLRSEAASRGLQLKIFHELPWERWWRGRAITPRRLTLRRLFQRMNNRNHRKVCLIDRAIAFVGSMNIVEYHLASYVGEAAWRDTGVMVQGGEVSILVESFNELWSRRLASLKLARLRHKAASSGALVKLNLRRSQRKENYLDLLVKTVGAKRRIWIENAYFVPDGSLVRALSVAAQSGVDVKILVPAVSDVVFIPWVTAAFHDGLLRAGVRIFEYTKGMLHAKTMLVDDWGLVGSSNLNHRSLLHDLEADVVLADEAACMALHNQFIKDCEHAREVTLTSWRDRPWIERSIGRTLLTIRKML
jgi:cardiolipin synthase